MRSLFLKIFLWFWLAMILVGLTFAVAAFTLRTDSVVLEWRAFAIDALTLYGQEAIEAMEKGNYSVLSEYLNQIEEKAKIRMFLFDEKGLLLSKAQPPPSASDLALRASSGEKIESSRFRKNPLLAKRIEGRSGRPYVIVAEMPGGPLSRFFGVRPNQLIRLFAIITVAGFVCFWLARYLANPIRKLGSATRALADGNLKVRVGSAVGGRRDEIAELAADFDMMAERIEALIDAQARLTRDISHELRSPLTRLSVALELARKKAEEDATEALDRIEREVNRLNEMIGQLLTLTRVETGTDRIQKVPVDLADLIAGVVEDAEFEAQGRNCSVSFSFDEEIPIAGVRDLLRSAIENVVRNGIRHTRQGTAVEITLGRIKQDSDVFAVVRTRDHGQGVPEEVIPELFQPFYRAGEARERSTGGAGLGLAIAERAVRLHGGTIKAANADEGGLIVEIRLPLSQ
jgi:two-component system sensor histidine kinase CpxA